MVILRVLTHYGRVFRRATGDRWRFVRGWGLFPTVAATLIAGVVQARTEKHVHPWPVVGAALIGFGAIVVLVFVVRCIMAPASMEHEAQAEIGRLRGAAAPPPELRKRCREFADELDGVVQLATFQERPGTDVGHAMTQMKMRRHLLHPAADAALRLYVEGGYACAGSY